MKSITILLAEDHTLVREGLRAMLSLEKDFTVTGGAQDGRKAIAMASEFSPDVVLMDIAMAGLNGLEATRQLLKILPQTKVIILTAHGDDAYVRQAAEAGAAGFVVKQDSMMDLCRAIRHVHQGHAFFSASIATRFTRLQRRRTDSSADHRADQARLTSREMEVFQLIAEGRPNKETAVELGISIKTVEKHRTHLMAKLDLHDTASLTRHAISIGIIENSVRLTLL